MNEFNILLVEDDSDWQYLLQQDVKNSVVNVNATPNIHTYEKFGDAFKALKSGILWHLLITDVCLGRHNKMGKELVRLAHESKIPTITVSGTETVNKMDVAELVETYQTKFFDKLLTNDIHDRIMKIVRQRYKEVVQKTEGDIVDFLIITALPEEFNAVKKRFNDVHSVDDIAYFATVDCRNNRKYRLILACQLYSGQLDAAALTSTLCERHKPRYVLLVGIAGGNKNEEVKLGDIIIAKRIEDCTKGKIAGSSVWQPEWTPFSIDAELIRKVRDLPNNDWCESINVKRPDKKKQAPGIKEGVIISGGNVIKEEAEGQWLERIKAREPHWLGVEMEGGGMATAIANYAGEPKPKFLMIRCVTDFADGDKNDHWHSYACDVAAAYTYAFLKSGPVPALNETPS